jgi:adenylate kinase family enzyme
MDQVRKLFIIGPAGSGKTTIAYKLSKKLNIESNNLDDLFWNNNSSSYNNKRNIVERMNLFQNILNRSSWIMEGAYIEWPQKAFQEAEIIIYLCIPMRIINYRIIKRYFLRKLGFEKMCKKETLTSLIDLLKWNKKQGILIEGLIQKLSLEGKNIIIFRTRNEIKEYIKSI